MARVFFDDCLEKLTNPYELAVLAGHRARQIANGAEATIPREHDKCTVVALREIAEETITPESIEEDLIQSFQKHAKVDEPETAESNDENSTADGNDATFGDMSEADLLAAIEGLEVPDMKDHDF